MFPRRLTGHPTPQKHIHWQAARCLVMPGILPLHDLMSPTRRIDKYHSWVARLPATCPTPPHTHPQPHTHSPYLSLLFTASLSVSQGERWYLLQLSWKVTLWPWDVRLPSDRPTTLIHFQEQLHPCAEWYPVTTTGACVITAHKCDRGWWMV